MAKSVRDLALFNMAIDSKLRGCDLVKLRVCDVMHGSQVAKRTSIIQQKTDRPVQFEITEQTRESLNSLIKKTQLGHQDCLFKSRLKKSPHLSTRSLSENADFRQSKAKI